MLLPKLWLKINHHVPPAYKTKTLLEIEDEIFLASVDQGVLMSKGTWFISSRHDFVPETLFFRATFAAATEDKMIQAIERFGVAVRDCFGLE